jgi:hypothetical protein
MTDMNNNGTDSNTSIGAKNHNGRNRNRGGKRNNGSNNINNCSLLDLSNIDKAFKSDNQALGMMYQQYYDCRFPADRVRYTIKTEKLQVYIGEKYATSGSMIRDAIDDPTGKRPSIPYPSMPKKPDPSNPKEMINKLEKELDYVERITLQEEIKLRLKDV